MVGKMSFALKKQLFYKRALYKITTKVYENSKF